MTAHRPTESGSRRAWTTQSQYAIAGGTGVHRPAGEPSSSTSRRRFLRNIGAAAGLGTLGALGLERAGNHLDLFSLGLPPRQYPSYNRETAGGWLKYLGNPVLGGSLGAWFDVCVLHEDGRYRMWVSWRPRASIALVESSDGVHWSPPRIVLAPGPQGSWQEEVNRPSVIKHAGQYHMWYTGQDKTNSRVGYATSADGVSWTRVGDGPVLTPDQSWEKAAVMTPSVLYDQPSGQFRMWYAAGDQYEPDAIGLATSSDGRRWTKYVANPVFKPGPAGAWDQSKVTAPQVLRDHDWHLMFYIGFYNAASAEIGVARSRNGIDGWQRHPLNPIIRPGIRPQEWDYSAASRPWAVQLDERWVLWYNGRRNSLEQIGLAIHPGTNLGFA